MGRSTAGGADERSDPRSRERLERAARGDAAAIEDLLREHLPGLRSYVRLRAGAALRERESTSDLVQSTCREVLSQLDRFEPRGSSSFRHWLYRTAERKIVDRARYWRAGRRGALVPPSEADLVLGYASLLTPSREAMAREQTERLERAFDRLRPEHRRVVILARVVGLSHREIAVEMERSEGAARALLFRALAELAEHLRET